MNLTITNFLDGLTFLMTMILLYLMLNFYFLRILVYFILHFLHFADDALNDVSLSQPHHV